MATDLQGSSHRPRAVGFRLHQTKGFTYEEIREDLKDMSNPYIELDIDKYMEKYDALEEEANQYKEKANHLEEQNAAMKAELVEKDNQLAALQERVRLLEQQTSSKGDQ